MKIKLWMTAPLTMIMVASACDSMLVEEPRSFVTTDTYYRTADDLDRGVLAGYNAIKGAFSATHSQWWGHPGMATDQETVHPTEVNQARLPDFLAWTAETPVGASSGWQNLFQAIYRMNLVLDRLPGVDMPAAQKAQLEAEARFIRGYSYMWLDRGYSAGTNLQDPSVPLLLAEADHLNPTPERATAADVQAQAIADLTAAEAALPTRTQRGNAGRGRATKGAAQMALADLHIWRSSFHMQNEWQQASDWAKKVIDSNQYTLLQSGWFNNWNPGAKANNTEAIFFLVASGNPGRQHSQFVNLHAPRDLGFGTGGGFGTNRATWAHVDSYAPGDIRGTVGGTTRVGMFEADSFAYRNHACSATSSWQSTEAGVPGSTPVPGVGHCGPLPYNSVYPYKFRPTALLANQGNVDVPLYRFAEAILFYAEAQNELGSPAVAIGELNKIRARARLGHTGTQNRAEPANLSTAMSQAEARLAIQQERSWELAHENKRWWDLVRMDSRLPGFWYEKISTGSPNALITYPDLAQRTYIKRFPVPNREIDINPSLTQNPGY